MFSWTGASSFTTAGADASSFGLACAIGEPNSSWLLPSSFDFLTATGASSFFDAAATSSFFSATGASTFVSGLESVGAKNLLSRLSIGAGAGSSAFASSFDSAFATGASSFLGVGASSFFSTGASAGWGKSLVNMFSTGPFSSAASGAGAALSSITTSSACGSSTFSSTSEETGSNEASESVLMSENAKNLANRPSFFSETFVSAVGLLGFGSSTLANTGASGGAEFSRILPRSPFSPDPVSAVTAGASAKIIVDSG